MYGGGHTGPIDVCDKLEPYSPYGHHKRMVEELGQSYSSAYGQPISAVRLFSVYGEGLRKQLLWELCQRLADGETDIVLGGSGTEIRDWHHVSDVVRILRRLVPVSGQGFVVYNGGAGSPAAVSEISHLVLKAWGGDHRLSFSGRSRPGDPERLISASSSMPSDCALRVGLKAGISSYVAWYHAEFLGRGVETLPGFSTLS